MLQQGDSKSPRALQGPTRCTHRLAGVSTHTEQQGTNRTAGQQDSILPSPLPKLFAPPALTEKHLPRLLCEPKGRKPALPGQTGDDIVASLSCKFLNTTSCQGPLPTAPGLHTRSGTRLGMPGTGTTTSPASASWASQEASIAQPGEQMPGLPACWKQSASREHIRRFLTHSAITFLSRAGSILG